MQSVGGRSSQALPEPDRLLLRVLGRRQTRLGVKNRAYVRTTSPSSERHSAARLKARRGRAPRPGSLALKPRSSITFGITDVLAVPEHVVDEVQRESLPLHCIRSGRRSRVAQITAARYSESRSRLETSPVRRSQAKARAIGGGGTSPERARHRTRELAEQEPPEHQAASEKLQQVQTARGRLSQDQTQRQWSLPGLEAELDRTPRRSIRRRRDLTDRVALMQEAVRKTKLTLEGLDGQISELSQQIRGHEQDRQDRIQMQRRTPPTPKPADPLGYLEPSR